MSIPYRDEQILRILADHPPGLTTAQILKIAKTQRGNELPNSNITSQRIYSLRESKIPKVESIDTADGRIHKITAAGRTLLAELGESDFITKKPSLDQTPHGSDIEKTLADNVQPPSAAVETEKTSGNDILTEFDNALAVLREAVMSALIEQPPSEPWPKITDKQAKIELLEKIENMPLLEIWASEMLGEIRQFVDQFDPE